MSLLKGIDVSGSNGIVDWDKAKDAGLDFAIIRCGFGDDIQSQDDVQFLRNVGECERLGIPWGIYLYSYAMNAAGIVSEISHVLRLLAGKKPAYPVFIDMEDADGYKEKHGGVPSKQFITDMIKGFCSAVEKAGYKPGWYCNKDWYNNHLYPKQLSQWPFWFARPGVDSPDLTCQIWQSQFGELGGTWPGVNVSCDLDISYIDYSRKEGTDMKTIVTYFGDGDIPGAILVAQKNHCPLMLKSDFDSSGIKADQAIQIGGKPGTDRFDSFKEAANLV